MIAQGGAGRRAVTQVAVGVLVRADGAVLLADRPAGKPYAGYWEFPGGKVEPGETVEQALARELGEELGVRVLASDPWTVFEYDYPHAYVRLHFCRIFDWSGTPHPVEGQRLMFYQPGTPAPAPLLPAAEPALRWIALPATMMRSAGTARTSEEAFAWIQSVLERGIRQILWHEPGLHGSAHGTALRNCRALAHAYGARLFAKCTASQGLPSPDCGADCACLLDAAQLSRLGARPPANCLAAGVRSRDDLERAAQLPCDFAVLEGNSGLGNDGDGGAADAAAIAAVCREAPIPVYVPLAPSAQNLQWARRHGAHGLLINDNGA